VILVDGEPPHRRFLPDTPAEVMHEIALRKAAADAAWRLWYEALRLDAPG